MLECMFVGYFRITKEKKLFGKSSMALECIRLSSVSAHIVHKKVCTKDCAQKMFRFYITMPILCKEFPDCRQQMFRLCRKNVQIVQNFFFRLCRIKCPAKGKKSNMCSANWCSVKEKRKAQQKK